ncbi:Bug family tripartite tricarboxylate transporter substrate binding protein [Achromobacter spanius]|uniref:Bug family tripartite tricarboxylate transporter substrate binding protein n=1 Tax=Achromobacter spanius TaxID=217203 RepID=UPI0036F18E73
MRQKIRALVFAALTTSMCAALPANAASEKPLRILVGFSAGGGTDQVARIFGAALQKELGQTVVVENRSGANGVIATQDLVKSEPDGNTIMIAVNSLVTNELLYKNLSYRVEKDVTPISLVSTVPFVLTSRKSFPATNLAELIAYAKANPGKVTYGSAGVGSPPHLFQELFDEMAGIKTSHVPYKGSAPAMADVLGGHIDLLWLTTLQAAPNLKDKLLRPLAVSSLKRSAVLPDVPTVDESGVKGYDADMWWGFVAPAHLPEEKLRRLESAFANIVKSPDMRAKLAELGSIPWGSSSAEFANVINRENEKWRPLIKSRNINLDQ